MPDVESKAVRGTHADDDDVDDDIFRSDVA